MQDGLAKIEAQDPELTRAAVGMLSELERSRSALGEVGMIHADLAPQNFRFEPGTGITSFDFANCCHHWFLYNLAVSRSVLHLQLEREKLDSVRPGGRASLLTAVRGLAGHGIGWPWDQGHSVLT